jgi:hypothetical protein
MLRADLAKDADDPAFQEGPKVFNSVGVKTAIFITHGKSKKGSEEEASQARGLRA